MVLILAIFAVALLLVLSVGLSTAVRAELLSSRTSLERGQSLFLAEAGINQARAILLYEDSNVDSLQDPWGLEADQPLDRPQSIGEAGYCRVRVSDACGRIDINAADFAALAQLTATPRSPLPSSTGAARGAWRGIIALFSIPISPAKGPSSPPASCCWCRA